MLSRDGIGYSDVNFSLFQGYDVTFIVYAH